MKSKYFFTLIELLVVIAIIAILAASDAAAGAEQIPRKGAADHLYHQLF